MRTSEHFVKTEDLLKITVCPHGQGVDRRFQCNANILRTRWRDQFLASLSGRPFTSKVLVTKTLLKLL